jgi:hypothetical protein
MVKPAGLPTTTWLQEPELHCRRSSGPVARGTRATLLIIRRPAGPCRVRQLPQWFNEQAAVEERMAAIGRIIVDAGHPTFITLQAWGGAREDAGRPCCSGLAGSARRRTRPAAVLCPVTTIRGSHAPIKGA